MKTARSKHCECGGQPGAYIVWLRATDQSWERVSCFCTSTLYTMSRMPQSLCRLMFALGLQGTIPAPTGWALPSTLVVRQRGRWCGCKSYYSKYNFRSQSVQDAMITAHRLRGCTSARFALVVSNARAGRGIMGRAWPVPKPCWRSRRACCVYLLNKWILISRWPAPCVWSMTT